MSAPVIETLDLTKLYGDFLAVDRVSFRVERGEVVGFLGPNGAGKSTTLRVLAGVLPPSAGTARIGGYDVLRSPRDARRLIGYLPERPPLYPEMTVAAYLGFMARVKDLGRRREKSEIERVIAETELGRVTGRLIARLSRGYQQRVAMAQALLGEPPLLLFDEPTLGLDPQQMQFVRALVRRLARDRTVFISTHFLYEVEEVCSRALIIQGGHLVADAPLEDLRSVQARERLSVAIALSVGAQRWSEGASGASAQGASGASAEGASGASAEDASSEGGSDGGAMAPRSPSAQALSAQALSEQALSAQALCELARLTIAESAGVSSVACEEHDPARFIVSCGDRSFTAADVARRLVGAGVPIAEISPIRRRLEDVYLELTDRSPGGGARRAEVLEALAQAQSDADDEGVLAGG